MFENILGIVIECVIQEEIEISEGVTVLPPVHRDTNIDPEFIYGAAHATDVEIVA